jgi:hypothetical protein
MGVKTLLLSGFAVAVLAATPGVHANLVSAKIGGGGPPAGWSFVQDLSVACTGSSTCATTLTGTTAGNFLVVTLANVVLGSATPITVTSVTTNSTPATCTHATGTAIAENGGGGGNSETTDIYYCPNIAGGSITVTGHLSGSSTIAAWNVVSEFSPGTSGAGADVGIGNTGATLEGGASSVSVATNGNLTQNNQLIISVMTHDDSPGTVSAGGGQTVINGDFPSVSYLIGGTSGSPVTQSYSWTSNGATAPMSIAAFSHP